MYWVRLGPIRFCITDLLGPRLSASAAAPLGGLLKKDTTPALPFSAVPSGSSPPIFGCSGVPLLIGFDVTTRSPVVSNDFMFSLNNSGSICFCPFLPVTIEAIPAFLAASFRFLGCLSMIPLSSWSIPILPFGINGSLAGLKMDPRSGIGKLFLFWSGMSFSISSLFPAFLNNRPPGIRSNRATVDSASSPSACST